MSPQIIKNRSTTIDKSRIRAYNDNSDRLTDTCEACDRGFSCGNPLFMSIYMSKAFITYEQQIDLSRGKNLVITDEQIAKNLLSEIGYFP